MTPTKSKLLATILLLTAAPLHAAFAQAPSLGTAESFAVLGAQTVTNTGPTLITGNLGVSPGTAITGFPPGLVIGAVHSADAVALQAQTDANAAYNVLAGEACNRTFGVPTDIGGLTLVPGVYCFSSSAQLTGTLTLDAQGDPNAVFIFKIASTLITASNSSVLLIRGAQPCKVFWQVGSSATIGTGTDFVGTIIALASTALQTNARLDGRTIALNGAVTLDSNVVSASTCAVTPVTPIPPSVGKTFTPASINAGGTSTLTLTLSNADSAPASLTTPLTDTLPAGIVVLGSASNTCGGIVSAPAGGSTLTLTGGVIPANGSCTVTAQVRAPNGGSFINAIGIGALHTTNGSNAAPAVATLTVIPVPGPGTVSPTLGKAFSPATIPEGGTSTLTITLSNPNRRAAVLTAPLTDTLPIGLVVAGGSSTTCGGTTTAVTGSSKVTLTGGSIPAFGSCTITVRVRSATAGNFINTLAAGALQTNQGSNAAPVVATLTVTPVLPNVAHFDCHFFLAGKDQNLSCTAMGTVCADQADTAVCARNVLNVECSDDFRLEDRLAKSSLKSRTLQIRGVENGNSAIVQAFGFRGVPADYQASLSMAAQDGIWANASGSCQFR